MAKAAANQYRSALMGDALGGINIVLWAHGRATPARILTIKVSILEIDRKFSGAISDVGIKMSNSASIESIRFTC